VKQLTATFTRKTQGVAEQRKELEALGSVEDLQQAAQLYQRMSDPSNWPEIHARLTEALEEQGLTPSQASAEAARQIGAEQPSPGELPDDPELQPFVKELQAQRAELAQLRAERNAEVQQATAERERQSMLNELQAAESSIRQANENYEQQDIDMVYKLASFHEADLHKSQAEMEEYVQGRIARYIASKQTPKSVAPAPAHAANSTEVPSNERSLEDVAAESTAYLRGLVEAGEVSLDGI
jgi:myosin heavy subunit